MIHDMIGGGAPLNFKVVGGTSAPATPRENTIWVNTDVEITSWHFCAEEPNVAEGTVWITTGTSSAAEFNALKKNGIQVYPMSAKQYISGAWADKEAKTYQSGAWVEWAPEPFYIFKAGEGALVTLNHYTAGGIAVGHTSARIEHKMTGADQVAVTATAATVSLKGYRTLKARAKCTYQNSIEPGMLGFYSSSVTSWEAYRKQTFIASVTFVADSTEKVYSVPVPDGVETAYIAYGGGSSAEIYDIWLE